MSHSISLPFISSLPQFYVHSLYHSISSPFLLTDSFLPCRDYAAVVFFANSRFETGKRKLQYLSFQDFAFCAGQLISYWTVGAVGKMPELTVMHLMFFFFLFLARPEGIWFHWANFNPSIGCHTVHYQPQHIIN